MPGEGPSCRECQDLGYRVEELTGEIARARRCDCQDRCRRCGGTGFVLVSAGDSPVAQPCACRNLDRRIAVFNGVGVPAAFGGASFASFQAHTPSQGQARTMVEDFAHKFAPGRPTRGLLLIGEPGCGKTHLLVSALRYLALEKGIAGRYLEFMLVLSDIRAGFESRRSHMEILRPLAEAPLLAIDELGKERGTEWERSMLDEMISRRYNAGLTTLFATNYRLQAAPAPAPAGPYVATRGAEFQRDAEQQGLEDRVGQRVFSRLREMCDVVRIDGPDARKQPGKGRGSYWRS